MLDGRLRYVALVDTFFDYAVHPVNGAVGFAADIIYHFRIAAVEGDELAVIGVGKQIGHFAAFADTRVFAGEEVDEITTLRLLQAVGAFQCIEQIGIFAVVGQTADDFTLLYLEDNVHTTTEVKAEIDLALLALEVVELYKAQVKDVGATRGVDKVIVITRVVNAVFRSCAFRFGFKPVHHPRK